jgi:uncharacterized OB-fold protein
MANTQVPAAPGWFTSDGPGGVPALLGSRCTTCGTLSFPKATLFCPNPSCAGSEFDEVPLSGRGTIWSYTDARYKPPPPFVPTTDPFEPFAIAAVELEKEKIVVLGQVVPGVSVDDLRVGMEVELVIDTLFTGTDDEGNPVDEVIWKWRPLTVGAVDSTVDPEDSEVAA